MVDPGEVITETLKREFAEEALNALELDEDQKRVIQEAVEQIFQNGIEVFHLNNYSIILNIRIAFKDLIHVLIDFSVY